MNETRRVSVRDVFEAGEIEVTDTLGKAYRIRGDLRPKGTAAPRAGELYLMHRTPNTPWRLGDMFVNPPTPVVTGSRAASDPLSRSLLAALVSLGLVGDQTSP